jgi:AsmA-like C-terminal region
VQSGDAGATLRFLDLYKRMVGGTLVMNAALGPATQTGSIAIEGFALRNEPALRRIFAQQEAPGAEERASAGVSRVDSEQVQFTKLTADFQRSQSRVDYKDVVIFGSQLGFTLSGYVDHARDRTDISGTFVPAYGLNNAFSQVPIVGLLLGGGNRNEGLFAVDFRISGAASAPTLTVNPLSAMAPGILRKFFGWAMPDGDVPTGAVPQRSDR